MGFQNAIYNPTKDFFKLFMTVAIDVFHGKAPRKVPSKFLRCRLVRIDSKINKEN